MGFARIRLLLTIFCLGSMPLGAITAKLRVGLIYPESGSAAGVGTDYLAGVQLALQDHIAANPAMKDFVKLIAIDDKSRSDGAKEAATRLLDQHRVHVLIGSISTTLNEDIIKLAEARNRLLFLPALDTHSLSGTSHTFIVGASPAQQGIQLAQFAKDRLRAKRIAIVRVKDEPYGNELAYAFRSHFPGTILADSEIDPSPAAMAKTLSTNPLQQADAIVLPLFFQQAQEFKKIAIAKGVRTTYLGGDGWDTPELYRRGSRIPGRHYFISSFNQRVPESKMQGFVKRFQQRYSRKPSALAYFGYSNMDIVLSAYRSANASRTPALKRALLQTKQLKPQLGVVELSQPGYVYWRNPIMQISSKGITMVIRKPKTTKP